MYAVKSTPPLDNERGKPTLRQDEDTLLSAGRNGLAELGDLCIADFKLVHVLDIPLHEKESDISKGGAFDKHTS